MKSLDQLYKIGGIFTDHNNDGYADGLKGQVILRENSNIVEKKIAINLCGRLGFETISLNLPVVSVHKKLKTLKGTNVYIYLNSHKSSLDENKSVINLVNSGSSSTVVLESSSKKALEYGGEYLYSRLPYIWPIGGGSLKLQDLKSNISSILSIETIYIVKLVIDRRYEGIYSCKILLQSNKVDETAKYIKHNQNQFKWDFISKVEFTITDKSKKKKIVVEGKKLCKNAQNKLYKCLSKDGDKVQRIDASNLYTIGGLFLDKDNDFLPDELNTKIVIPDDADDYKLIAACNVAARLGLETLGITFPLVCCKRELNDGIRNPILIGRGAINKKDFFSDKAEIQIVHRNDNNLILIEGKNEGLLRASKYFSESFPYLTDSKKGNLMQFRRNLMATLKAENFEGQLINLLSNLKSRDDLEGKEISCYFDNLNGQEKRIKNIRDYFENAFGLQKMKINSYKDNEIVFEKKYEIQWEVDKFKKILRERVFAKVKNGDRVNITGVLSEEKEVREKLKKVIEENIRQKGGTIGNCKIYCSYKQGLSWVLEEVIPRVRVKKLKNNIGSIVIRFKRFFIKERNKWQNMDGTEPSYNSYPKDNDRCFDLPIRWLQEIYPIDDLLAKELGINRGDVHFEPLKNDSSNTYEIIIRDKDGCKIIKDAYTAKYSERPYLYEYPRIGKVHPSTGWITVEINDDIIVDENIKTDLEEVWDLYQKDILKKCKEYIINKTQGKPAKEDQPFFKELRIDVSLSEPDYGLNIREDRISALEGLHEDLYFVGLDFFKAFGERSAKQAFSETGLILPCVKKRKGIPGSMKATLLVEKYSTPRYLIGNNKVEIPDRGNFDVEINKVCDDGKIKSIEVDIIIEKHFKDFASTIQAFCDLYNQDLVGEVIKLDARSLQKIRFNLLKGKREISFEINLKNNLTLTHDEVGENRIDINSALNNVIGYEDYRDIIEFLRNKAGLDVWKAGESYQGRDIYAIDVTSSFDCKLVSRTKLINFKPTYMLINRHHANEVSSTNSSFMLALKSVTDENYREYLKKVNLTIIPIENVDGSYIHYRLQEQNPTWMLHAARYNSVGKEFAFDYWKDTKYGESKVVPEVWRRWLPDMVVDNHGVPSHEWTQQFSGYVSPSFKGFWLPRGLWYGIFYYLNFPKYERQKKIFECIQKRVANRLNFDEEIMRYQIDWRDRFEKYANKWMPKMFPVNYYKDLIFYWIPCNPNDKNFRHPSFKYPQITAIDWVTEVSDETAQGDYLKLCVKAHHIADIAVIDLLYNTDLEIENLSTEQNNKITLKRIRKRPINIK